MYVFYQMLQNKNYCIIIMLGYQEWGWYVLRKIFSICIAGICLLLVWGNVTTVCASDIKGRVLFISSYSYSWDTVQMQVAGIQNTLGNEYEIDYEYMDTKRVSDETSMRLFSQNLAYRMSKVKPYDVIIVGDDAALQFVMEHRNDMFKGIPIVFEGVNSEDLVQEALKDSHITGVVEKLNVENTLDMALQLIPKAKKVVAVLDDTITGKAERKRYYKVQEQYPKLVFDEINVSKLTTDELKNSLQELTKDTILLFVVMTEDADGRQYNSQQAGEFMLTYAAVPAFRMVEAGIGDGFIGGDVVSMYKSGEEAARMAIQVMKGALVEKIPPVLESPRECILDEAVIRKFNISIRRIPDDTTILNHKESFVEKNKDVMDTIIVFSCAAIALLTWAIYDNYKMRKLLIELKDAQKILENASQHDFLTGLSNRSKFMSDLDKLIETETPCTVFMLDIDDFKHINDTYGHDAGDITLQEIANRMKNLQTPILTPYRYAGDEFIMILRSEQERLIEKTAYATRDVFGKKINLKGCDYQVGGSIGIATYPKDAKDMETLITCADDAMYVVKKSGKNQFAYFQQGMAHEEQK